MSVRLLLSALRDRNTESSIPLAGQNLINPARYAVNGHTQDPSARPRLPRVGRPNHEGPGGYSPNDPLMNYHWFATIPGVLDQGEFIQSITTPSIRYDQQSRFENGKMHHYAGFMSVDDMQMTIYTDISGTAIDVATKWVRNVRDSAGIYRLPKDYKKKVVLYILDQDDRIISEIHYTGCWITSWDSYSLDFNGASILVTNLSVSVDDFYIEGEADAPGTLRSQSIPTVNVETRG